MYTSEKYNQLCVCVCVSRANHHLSSFIGQQTDLCLPFRAAGLRPSRSRDAVMKNQERALSYLPKVARKNREQIDTRYRDSADPVDAPNDKPSVDFQFLPPEDCSSKTMSRVQFFIGVVYIKMTT